MPKMSCWERFKNFVQSSLIDLKYCLPLYPEEEAMEDSLTYMHMIAGMYENCNNILYITYINQRITPKLS